MAGFAVVWALGLTAAVGVQFYLFVSFGHWTANKIQQLESDVRDLTDDLVALEEWIASFAPHVRLGDQIRDAAARVGRRAP